MDVFVAIRQRAQPVMSQRQPTVPSGLAELTVPRERSSFRSCYSFIPFECLVEKLHGFLVGIVLHGLLAGLFQVFHRFVQSLSFPQGFGWFGGLRPVMSQERVIGFEIFLVVFLDPLRD